MFEKAEVRLKGGPLMIVAENHSASIHDVQKVRLNDMQLDRAWIKHSDIEPGGVLEFEMSPQPQPRK